MWSRPATRRRSRAHSDPAAWRRTAASLPISCVGARASDLFLQDEETDPVPGVHDPAAAAPGQPDPDGAPICRHHVQPAPGNDAALADKAHVATYQELYQQRRTEDLDPARYRNMVLPRTAFVVTGGSPVTSCVIWFCIVGRQG